MAKTKCRTTPKGPTPVEALKHKDQRINIPTEELREFVKEAEEAPTTLLYPRDPSLDPQLVWKGKDEQDRGDLAVPAVPIYIQEKIHPQALIENLRKTTKAGEREPEQLLFADFNGIEADLARKIAFYSYDLGSQPKWSNRMILGDSLFVMASIAEKEGLKGKVQMIYVDPPYGIKFGSNWQVSTRKRDIKDGKVEDLAREPEVVKAFRDTWELGIHSYLAYLRDRLVVARQLLTETGSIFVQIGDENVHLVRSVMDEVFGSECHVVTIVVKKKGAQRSSLIDPVNDFILWYSRTPRGEAASQAPKFRPVFESRALDSETISEFSNVELESGELYPLSGVRRGNQIVDYRLFPSRLFADHLGAKLFASNPLTSGGERLNQSLPFTWEGHTFEPGQGNCWKHTARSERGAAGMARLGMASRLIPAQSTFRFKRYLDDFRFKTTSNWWDGLGGASNPMYVVQTNTELVKRCLLMTTDPGDLVLDPTCGSGTTAYVAEQWGRRWITIDTSRVALALARARLMAARYPYYLLADSLEGRAKETEVTQSPAALESPATPQGNIKRGFVYERAVHITSSLIANNEEIDAIWDRFRGDFESLHTQLEPVLGQRWNESDVPRKAEAQWTAAAKKAHAEWWRLRRGRQAEIDASIARRAGSQPLYDRPYEDGKRIRVTGPFTVESLSPHRVLSADDQRPASEACSAKGNGTGRFETTILENLRKTGVQNTKRNERLVFDRLESYAGEWLQAAGEYTDAAGRVRRVAVSIGPEHGTVGPRQVQEAAKEAVRGIPFDLVLVLGFAFDAHAGEVAREASPEGHRIEEGFVAEGEAQYGKLPVLLVRMNPDLAMGDELLKKTGSGNLFMVFGEPDVKIDRTKDDKLIVEIKGVDVYDPTTGVVRSSSTDDIACWFLDTDYNGESFFVRHAYFCGAEFDKAYEHLEKALKTDITKAAWATLYRTMSRPFASPESGRIAVKVINHYGDEVLRIYQV